MKREAAKEPTAKPAKAPRQPPRSQANSANPSATTPFFVESNFLAPLVAQFLGVRGLLRFSATSRAQRSVVSAEVSRRKAEIAEIEASVRELVHDPVVPRRADVFEAQRLCQKAKRMIDLDLDWQDRVDDKYDELKHDNDELFTDQRKLLSVVGWPPVLGSLHMLPLCFYVPPQGEAEHPDDDALDQMKRRAGWLWGAEDHMGTFYEMVYDYPSYDYRHPFRKFEHHLASFFRDECMMRLAMDIANSPDLDAFRVAARSCVTRSPNSQDCLHYVISKADEMTTAEMSQGGSHEGE